VPGGHGGDQLSQLGYCAAGGISTESMM
jgi:hypothetical protein